MGRPRKAVLDVDLERAENELPRLPSRVGWPRGGTGPVVETGASPGFQQAASPKSPDLQTVMTLPGYRVGYLPPPVGSLPPGLLYVEQTPPGGGAPRLWIGTAPGSGFAGNTALLIPGVTIPSSVIAVNDPDNPSPNDAVVISGTVEPGCEVEIAALSGTDPDQLVQLTNWSPWDASSGAFDTVWWLPEGDNYRIRVRMRDDPSVYADSALFAAVAL